MTHGSDYLATMPMANGYHTADPDSDGHGDAWEDPRDRLGAEPAVEPAGAGPVGTAVPVEQTAPLPDEPPDHETATEESEVPPSLTDFSNYFTEEQAQGEKVVTVKIGYPAPYLGD